MTLREVVWRCCQRQRAPPVCCRSGLLVVPVGGGFPLLLLVAPLVFRAPARPRDRHTRASLGVVNLEARPGPAAAHRHRVCLVSIRFRVVDLEAWLGPAAAHRHRGLALLWSLRHYANPNSADRPRGGLQSVGVVVCVLPALAL